MVTLMKISKMCKHSEEHEQLRAGLIFRTPELFKPPLSYIDQIYSMINTYVARKDYQVVRGGLNAIFSIVYKYIDIRQGTFFHPMPFAIPAGGGADLSHDPFLNDVFEKMSALQRIASAQKDLELSKDILECLSKIAQKCADIEYRTKASGGLHHCMLAVQYMKQNIEDSLSTNLLDIGISGSIALRDIGIFLIAKNDSTGIRMIIKHLSKIVMYGIAKPQATFLISYPLQAYSMFIRAFVFSKKYYDSFLPQTIFEEVQGLVNTYVEFKEKIVDPLSMDLQYSFGPFIDLSSKVAMPYVFNEAYNEVIGDKLSFEDKDIIIDRILGLSEQIWRFYDSLSKSAAKNESFLIHFIGVNLHHIAMVLSYFYELDILGEERKRETRDRIGWIISNYWRIYYYHDEITKSYEMQMFDDLLELGNRFNDLSLLDEIWSVIDIIVSIADSFLKKQKNSYGFDPIRILLRAAYLCILADSASLNDKFIKRIKDDFWQRYIEKYPQHSNRFFDEILSVDPVEIRLNGLSLSYERRFLSKLEKTKIESFVAYLKDNLKREPDES